MKQDQFNKWNSAHVFYGDNICVPNNSKKIIADDLLWREKAISESKNGKLLIENSFFKTLKNDKKIYLAHITPKLKNIIKDNNIQPSGGCLVGSIYCTQLFNENKKLRMHNLGKYILEEEAPRILNGDKFLLEILVIEIDLQKKIKNNLKGIDYLRLGEIHFDIYKQLEYLLSHKERNSIEKICEDRIKKSLKYLNICNELYFKNKKVDSKKFLNLFIDTIEYLPILGYLYFEVIGEYIMLYQDNDQSLKYKELGEFYSPTYKNLISSQYPKLSVDFSLRQFRPSLEFLINYFKKNNIFRELDIDHFISYISNRIIFLTNARFFSNKIEIIDFNKIELNFNSLSHYVSPLLGHLIHRELRSFGRYPSFYFYFDQYKALEVWNYWNYMNIAVPFNGIIPKGEIGINPAYTDLKYRVYTCKVKKKLENTYLEIKKEIKINIVPELINLKFAFMRSKDDFKY
ncbi:MAG: hypothetical protein AAB696_02030 [Patescibacteria group bacterium]